MPELEPNVGIVGTHVGLSLSPVMHNAAYQEMGIDLRYGTFTLPEAPEGTDEVDYFSEFLRQKAGEGVLGLSVTMPYKLNALESDAVSSISDMGQKIGAINTLSATETGMWVADNTDWLGAMASLEEAGVDIQDKLALVLGAGGTARAVAFGLAQRGASSVVIANRNVGRAEDLARDLTDIFDSEVGFYSLSLTDLSMHSSSGVSRDIFNEAGIIYQTTSVGQQGTDAAGQSLIDELTLRLFKQDGLVLNDAVYQPLETPLMQIARERGGITVIDGTRMLLHQAVAQVRIFTGEEDVPIEVMDAALQAEIQVRQSK